MSFISKYNYFSYSISSFKRRGFYKIPTNAFEERVYAYIFVKVLLYIRKILEKNKKQIIFRSTVNKIKKEKN